MSTREEIESGKFYDNENDTGLDRVKKLYKDVFNGTIRAELNFVAQSLMFSFLGGACWRGFFGSDQILRDFRVKHNASVFLGKHDAKKQFMWFAIDRMVDKGFRFGTKCAIFAGFSSFIVMNSIVYRKDIKILDTSAGIGLSCALTRYNKGLRAISSAFTIGFVLGLAGFCMIKGGMYLRNYTVKDWLNEMNKEMNRGKFVQLETETTSPT